MVSKFLNIGDRAEITLKRDIKSVRRSFSTKIVDFVEDNPSRFIISCPTSFGKIVLLPDKETYTLIFYTKTSVVSCDCRVIEHFKNDIFHNTLMEVISDFEKTQRRQFFRYACSISFKFVKLDVDADQQEIERTVTMVDGVVTDLGGGGIRFVSKDGLEVGNFVQIALPIDDEMIIAVGKIILKTCLSNNSAENKFEYRLKFSAIERTDQDNIVKYVLEEQRRFLKKTGVIQRLN